MISTTVFFIGLLLFWGVIIGLRNLLKRRGFTVYPFLLLWRKATRSEWFPKVAKSKSFRIFENLSVILAIISMIGGVYLIVSAISDILVPTKVSSVKLEPIIPGVTIGLNQAPYILLSIGISVMVHEIMHAIASTSNKIPVKGGGFILLAFFPGAFVEPDEESFLNSPTSTKLKIISAGIAINLILAGLFFPLAAYLPQTLSQGILIEGVVPNSAAYNASIHPGDVIESVNGIKVTDPSQLRNVLEQSTNYRLTLVTPSGFKTINLSSSTHFLGVYISYYFPAYIYPILSFFLWMFIVNFSLALLNGAPLIITDGGKLFTELMKKIKINERFSMIIQAIIVLLLVVAVTSSFIPQ
ncbi:MAG: site-2 protease family protein [Metallosphaera sp.]